MSKHFRPWNIDQTLLLPPNVRDFVPKDHVSRFIVGLVRESRARSAGLPNDQGLPQAPFEGARRVVPPGSEVVRDSRAGQTRPRRIGWHEDQSECVET